MTQQIMKIGDLHHHNIVISGKQKTCIIKATYDSNLVTDMALCNIFQKLNTLWFHYDFKHTSITKLFWIQNNW